MRFNKTSILLALPMLMFAVSVNAQASYTPSKYRSSFNERKKSIMDANDMRATYHNFGQGGRVSGNLRDEFPYEYPKNSRREYMLFIMTVFGAEVRNQAANPVPRTFPIVNFGNLKVQQATGKSWSLNPITGYSNPSSRELARSDRGPGNPLGNTWPNTWPDKLESGGDGWPGSWNGFFGRDQFNADLEFFYRMSDDQYDRYVQGTQRRYQPDATDATRGGLGVIVDSRIMAWTQTLISNIHFNIFELTNDSSYDYDKFSFGLWMADLVATTSTDDVPEFDVIRSIAYITDGTRVPFPPFFEGPIGEMGIKFLETPGNALDGIDNDADSYQYDTRETNFYNSQNANLYSRLLTANGGFFNSLAQVDSFIPKFVPSDFTTAGTSNLTRTILPGEKLVLIDTNYNRIVTTYVGGATVKTRGRGPITLPLGGLEVPVEDFLPENNPDFGIHFDLVDNDFDGLIDESRTNHLTKNTFDNAGNPLVAPVRYINYRMFAVGDTIPPGMIVSTREHRQRMASDASYRDLVNTVFGGRMRNYHTAAPMIDEARDDYFDNDADWVAASDDVGIAGDRDTPSTGTGDGLPTSGAGTPFPGEPSIDKTDVSETDLIGVSRATIVRAGVLDWNQDEVNWLEYLIPGDFQLSGTIGQDADIFVTSGLFPLRQGQTERFAVAIGAVQTKSPARADDRAATNRALVQANNAYEADYQFATAPPAPNVRAVAYDRKVVLYWDTQSENTYDRYIARITGNGNDFEGYRVYRSTDVGLEDSRQITDAFGTPLLRAPIAIFDLVNEYSGLHPVPINGVQYQLGSNSGIRRMYVDTTVQNGREYFYAVTAFDHGLAIAGIAPSESPIQSSREQDGSVTLGPNVVRVRPAKSPAGVINPDNPLATRIQGGSSGTVSVNIVDPKEVRKNNVYRMFFQDTLISGTATTPDTLRTKNFSLVNITANPPDTLVKKSRALLGQDVPVIQGFRLTVNNETRNGLINESVRFNNPQVHTPQVLPNFKNLKPSDYMIVFTPPKQGAVSSNKTVQNNNGPATYPSRPSNVRVYNLSEGKREVEFAFFEQAPADSAFTARINAFGSVVSDFIILIEDFGGRGLRDTWRVRFVARGPTSPGGASRNPTVGDTLYFSTYKPFTSYDIYEFRMDSSANTRRYDKNQAKLDLDKIKVVPNPYVVSSGFEPPLTSSSNQQQRELHFTNMPIPSTLRIFTVSGVLVREIRIEENDQRVHDGTYVWNMLTKDNLEISYGVYLFHVKAPGVGEKIGKFAVIK